MAHIAKRFILSLVVCSAVILIIGFRNRQAYDNRSQSSYSTKFIIAKGTERDTVSEQELMANQVSSVSSTTVPRSQVEKQLPVVNVATINFARKFQTEMTSPEVFAERRARVDDICARQKVKGEVKNVYTDTQSGVIYCFVPKTGCTFWKRVFQFQYLKKSKHLKSPWDISRVAAHTDRRYADGFKFKDGEHSSRRYPTRLLVTRDPFSRLLSTYLDKFYLPDFWRLFPYFARHAYTNNYKRYSMEGGQEDFFRIHFDEMARRFEPRLMKDINSTWQYVTSVKYLTFADFVRASLQVDEVHWMPIHSLCNPCLFGPTHISNMETFSSDARVILDKMNIGQLLDDIRQVEQVDMELQLIVDYNFQRWKFGPGSYLSGNTELAYRLWHNFQWRGYIHPDVEYIVPLDVSRENTQKDLLLQLSEARKQGLQDPNAMKMVKKKYKINAYQTLDKDLFSALISKFSTDIALFGFEEHFEKLKKDLLYSGY